MKRTQSAWVLTLALGLAVTGCASTDATEATPTPTEAPAGEALTLDELVDAAKAEGTVRVYTSLPESDQEKLATAFTEKYGIKVESLRLGGNTLATRFETEADAGSPTGEVLLSTALDFLLGATEQGTLLPFEETGVNELLGGLPEEAILDDYAGIPVFQVMSTGFIYNTNLVDESDLPDSWTDFVESDLAGEACAVAPDTSEALMVFMASLRDADGDATLEKLGQSIARWFPSVVPMNEAVAAGECAIGLNSAEFFTHIMKAQGAPVEFATAPSASYPVVSAAVASGAEHPNAARLFMHYALSPEGSAVIFDPATGSFGAFDAAEYPADFGVLPPTKHKEVLAQSQEVLKLLGF